RYSKEYPGRVKFFLGDVRSYESVYEAVKLWDPDYIVNAAAVKHVPDCEKHVWEAVQTNIVGARNIVRVAREFPNIKRVLGISTDKAVESINVMGMTKAIQERLFLSQDNRNFNVVRFGNVIGSTGSVIPLFDSLGKVGENIPITDESMTRFLLKASEAVNLVIYGLEQAEPGRIIIPIMPACSMGTLASVFCRHYNVESTIVGSRPGEKRDEVINNEYEASVTYDIIGTQYRQIYPYGSEPPLTRQLSVGEQISSQNAARLGINVLRELLMNEGYLR
ncbi:MAG TPA: UDP-N-acetylglucosamine 4,6-dehydratase (inverting), partial [Cytophagales bacterium]|nr:UDP-N-acetylglucosamine 4,6-dehydratase (inverting) [Cytophagales bacterium]